ncbi:MAG: GDP-mannose 4,6-dehydratase, partial [Alphaproteobacteria bacterium]|nr:GDP-mannose 4,6-dehydratase [Alphaproteobacteria bacterium]
VRAMVFYNSWNAIGWLSDCPAEIRNSIEIFPADIRDPERVAEAVIGQDYVFHLSSLIAIPYSYVAAHSYVQTNIQGAVNVLEGCRRADCAASILHVSTSETYGSAQTVPISEDHPLVGQSPYSASKIGADKMAESYYLSFDMPVITARPFNTFGPRQTARAVIPTIAAQLLSGVDKLKLGALDPTRDFNFARDTAAGMIALATCSDAIGKTVNIGTNQEWSIGETARMLMEITGREVPTETEQARIRPKNSEVNRLIADNSLIKELTDWSPEVEFKEGLTLTAEWIERNLDHFDPSRYSI